MDPGRLAERRQKAAENRVAGKCTNCGGPTPWKRDRHFARTCSAECLKVRYLRGRIEQRLQRRKCTNCGGPTPFSKNGIPLKTCSGECYRARLGSSGRVANGRRWRNVEGQRVYLEPYECEYCHKKFPRRLRGNHQYETSRFCSRQCWQCWRAERKKDQRGRLCSIHCGYCASCGKAFVARRRQKYCRTRQCDMQVARDLSRALYRAKERPRCVCVKCRESFYPEPGSHNRRYCSAHYNGDVRSGRRRRRARAPRSPPSLSKHR